VFVFLGLAIALVFVTGISAGAEPGGRIREKKAEVAAAQDRLMEIRMEASTAQAAYNNALYEMNQLNEQMARTRDDLDAAKKRVAEAKENLEERAAQVYKSGNVAFMDVLVGVDNFSEFASRLDLWVRLLDKERTEFLEFREARNELAARRDRLAAEREQRIDAVETAIAQKKRADKAEAQAEAYLNSLTAELRDAIQAAQDRQAEQSRAAIAAVVDKAPAPEDAPATEPEPVPVEEPEPTPEVQVSQVDQVQVPKPDLQSEQAAAEREAAAQAAAAEAKRLAEQRAAEREAARKAAEQAAEQAAAQRQAARLAAATRQEAREEAQRQAELAAQRAADRQAARQEAERQAELAASRAAAEEAAAEQAAAERQAARLAADRRADR
jgi:peptidoglycan hydrolase CwlO-like protein